MDVKSFIHGVCAGLAVGAVVLVLALPKAREAGRDSAWAEVAANIEAENARIAEAAAQIREMQKIIAYAESTAECDLDAKLPVEVINAVN